MGLAESLERANYLRPISDVLMDMANRREKEKQFNAFVQAMDSMRQEGKNLNAPVIEQESHKLVSQNYQQENLRNPSLKINKLSDIANQQGTTLGNFGKKEFIPQTVFDKDITINKETPVDNETFNKRVTDLYRGYYEKTAGLDMLDPNEVNKGFNLLGMIANSNRPMAPEFKTVGKGNDLVWFNPKTKKWELSYSNVDEDKGDIYEDIRTFDVNGIPISKGLRRDTGQWEELGKDYYKPNVTNINMPPTEGKWAKFTDLVSDVMNPVSVREDEKTGEVKVTKLTPEEIKYKKDKLYTDALGNMVPSAVQWYNQKVKDAWGREDMSEADFYAEVEDATVKGEFTKDKKGEEAIQDLLDFGAYRRYIFDLSTKSYKGKQPDNDPLGIRQ